MALRNYNITARLGGDPTAAGASGLTPTWVFFDTEAGAPESPVPTFSNPGGKGIYRFQYDAITNGEAVGIVDFGSGFTDPNERYADVVVTLDGALIQANLDINVGSRNSVVPPTAGAIASAVLSDVSDVLGVDIVAIKAKTDLLAVDSTGKVGANNLPADYQQRGVAVVLPTTPPTGYALTGIYYAPVVDSGTTASTNLVVTVTNPTNSATSRLISWTADSAATSYKVMRSTDGVNYTKIATIAAGTLSYTDAARPSGNVYYSVLSVH